MNEEVFDATGNADPEEVEETNDDNTEALQTELKENKSQVAELQRQVANMTGLMKRMMESTTEEDPGNNNKDDVPSVEDAFLASVLQGRKVEDIDGQDLILRIGQAVRGLVASSMESAEKSTAKRFEERDTRERTEAIRAEGKAVQTMVESSGYEWNHFIKPISDIISANPSITVTQAFRIVRDDVVKAHPKKVDKPAPDLSDLSQNITMQKLLGGGQQTSKAEQEAGFGSLNDGSFMRSILKDVTQKSKTSP